MVNHHASERFSKVHALEPAPGLRGPAYGLAQGQFRDVGSGPRLGCHRKSLSADAESGGKDVDDLVAPAVLERCLNYLGDTSPRKVQRDPLLEREPIAPEEDLYSKRLQGLWRGDRRDIRVA